MKQYIIAKGSNKYGINIPAFALNKSFSYKFIIEADNFDFDKPVDFGTLCGIKYGTNLLYVVWRFNKDRSTFEYRIVRKTKMSEAWSDTLYGATCIVTYNKEDKTFDIQVADEKATYNMRSTDDKKLLNAPIIIELRPYFKDNISNADYTITRI